MSDTPDEQVEDNPNGTVPDGPLINDEVVGVDYEAPTEGPEVEPPEGEPVSDTPPYPPAPDPDDPDNPDEPDLA